MISSRLKCFWVLVARVLVLQRDMVSGTIFQVSNCFSTAREFEIICQNHNKQFPGCGVPVPWGPVPWVYGVPSVRLSQGIQVPPVRRSPYRVPRIRVPSSGTGLPIQSSLGTSSLYGVPCTGFPVVFSPWVGVPRIRRFTPGVPRKEPSTRKKRILGLEMPQAHK